MDGKDNTSSTLFADVAITRKGRYTQVANAKNSSECISRTSSTSEQQNISETKQCKIPGPKTTNEDKVWGQSLTQNSENDRNTQISSPCSQAKKEDKADKVCDVSETEQCMFPDSKEIDEVDKVWGQSHTQNSENDRNTPYQQPKKEDKIEKVWGQQHT